MNLENIYIKIWIFVFCWKYEQKFKQQVWSKLLDIAKKSTADAIKTAWKRAIQKTWKTTDGLIGDKIAGKCFKTVS